MKRQKHQNIYNTFRPLRNDFLFERRNSDRLIILAGTYIGTICESKLEFYPIFTSHIVSILPTKKQKSLKEKNSKFFSEENHRTLYRIVYQNQNYKTQNKKTTKTQINSRGKFQIPVAKKHETDAPTTKTKQKKSIFFSFLLDYIDACYKDQPF